MTLLDNELVRKYFCRGLGHFDHMFDSWAAQRILEAMQQPIRKGERYLGYFFNTEEWKVDDAPQNNNDPFHPAMLRLPDAFQKQEKKCGCGLTWGTIHRFDGPCYVLENTPSPEKCEHGIKIGFACAECFFRRHPKSKPKDAVALKIEAIMSEFPALDNNKDHAKRWMRESLADLVKTAKDSVPECEGDH